MGNNDIRQLTWSAQFYERSKKRQQLSLAEAAVYRFLELLVNY